MKRLLAVLSSLLLLGLVSPVWAKVNVFACEPEWGALADEIGGSRVEVFNATTGSQDVHHIQARPSLIARARTADLLVCSGADLEIGWLPLVLRQAGNAKIQPGRPGNLEAAQFVRMLDVPAVLDRSMGDVHPRGNPHVHWDPRNIEAVAKVLSERLAQIDPQGAAEYRNRLADFGSRWSAAARQWEEKAAALRGANVIEHHRALSYLFAWLGMRVVGSLEPRPGVEPTSSHLASLVQSQQSTPAKMIVRTTVNNAKASQWLAEQAKIPAVELPYSVGGTPAAKDLFSLYEDAISRLLSAAKS